ncbi:hypothetical protein ACH4JZ_10800 [Streptomyces sp. NPDC017615]|uniref:hypothetical protein n=1 Tax=Streptomyces sp. NPDC017615 TaxID=3365003 RepID=UPI0037A6200B
MEIAKLVLEFTKVLVWPVVVLFVLVFFRAETRDLFRRLRALRGGLAEAEFAEQAALARAESELASVDAPSSTDADMPFFAGALSAAFRSPDLAVLQAWETLERQLEHAVTTLGLKRRTRGHPVRSLNVTYAAQQLVGRGLPASTGTAIIDLHQASRQIFELGASLEGARDFIEACNNVYRQLAGFLTDPVGGSDPAGESVPAGES